MGELDGGNSDLFMKPAMIEFPFESTGGRSDYIVTLHVWNTQREGMFFVAFRYQDPSNYYALEYENRSRKVYVKLVKIHNGIRQVLEEARQDENNPIPDLAFGGGPHNGARVSVAMTGSTICVGIGPRIFLSATDSDFATGTVVLGHHNYHPHFDRIEVYEIGGSGGEEPREQVHVAPVAIPETSERYIIVPCSDRDEALGLMESLSDLGVYQATILDVEESVVVQIGPLPKQVTVDTVVGMLEDAGMEYEEKARSLE